LVFWFVLVEGLLVPEEFIPR
jgi:hypothetical protein